MMGALILLTVFVLSSFSAVSHSTPLDTKNPMIGLADAIAAKDAKSPGYALYQASYDRFMVKYLDEGATPGQREAAMIEAINKVVDQADIKRLDTSGVGLTAQEVRPLALDADLIRFSRALAPVEITAVLRALSTSSRFKYFVPDYPVQLEAVEVKAIPNDPQLPEQWDFFEPGSGINVPGAWEITQGSAIVVAVIDGGFVEHRDLSANIVAGYSFTSPDYGPDPHDQGPSFSGIWHGTHVAGTVSAVGGNSAYSAGVAYAAKIQPVRIFAGGKVGELVDVYNAMAWSAGIAVPGVPGNITPANVINMSFGLEVSCAVMTPVQEAVDAGVGRGVTYVAAAGNDNKDALGFSPAGCLNLITVAATTREGGKWSLSNFGTTDYVDMGYPPAVTVSAPGVGIWSLHNLGVDAPIPSPAGDALASASGTSMASPHVAGVVALMQAARRAAQRPLLTPAQVKLILEQTAQPLLIAPEPGKLMGAGIVNATAAVRAAEAVTD